VAEPVATGDATAAGDALVLGAGLAAPVPEARGLGGGVATGNA
jgi:hypothetical protein